jgi:hypothetical protein
MNCVLCGHSADVCNGRQSVGECWMYVGSTWTAIRLTRRNCVPTRPAAARSSQRASKFRAQGKDEGHGLSEEASTQVMARERAPKTRVGEQGTETQARESAGVPGMCFVATREGIPNVISSRVHYVFPTGPPFPLEGASWGFNPRDALKI